MNKNIFEGKWDQLKGSVKKKWGDLTDNDLKEIEGDRDRLVGKIKERYGKNQEEAEREVKDYENNMRDDPDFRMDNEPNPNEHPQKPNEPNPKGKNFGKDI